MSLVMDPPQKTLIGIASVSQRIVNTLDRSVGRKTFELEASRLDKIVVGARTVLEALNKTLLLKNGYADARLVDWLNSEEPRVCLQTLNQMEEILNGRPNSTAWKDFLMAPWSGRAQDKSSEAISLFQMRKAYFQPLLTAGLWNCESGTQQQTLSTTQLNLSPLDDARQDLVTTTKPSVGSPVSQVKNKSMMEGKSTMKLEKLDSILEWLNAWNSRETHERTVNLRQPGTCTWLHKTSVYKSWRSAGKSFLWIHRKPGAGKSVLASSVIKDLGDTLQDGELLAYFYCNFQEERSTSAVEVLRSLLSQLLRQFHHHMDDPGDLLDELVERKEGDASTINNSHLLACYISHAARQFCEPPFLVVDALDECRDLEELLDALTKLQKDNLRLLITSRPLQIIKDGFLGLPVIDMEETSFEISADIRLHVAKELDSHRRLRTVPADLKEEIHSVLCDKAGGMFRWVQCQLNTLKQCITTLEFREALDDLPSDLDETYGRILMGIDKTGRESKVVRRALDWLVVARRSLRLVEILEGISVDLEQQAMISDSVPVDGTVLLDILGSLVTYDEVTDIVILSHFSVKEYLTAESTRKTYPIYYVDQQAAHTQLALVCLNYFGIYLRHHQYDDSEVSLVDTYKLPALRNNSDSVPLHSRMRFSPSIDSHPLLQYLLPLGFRHLSQVDSGNKAILQSIIAFYSDTQQHPLEWEQMCEIVDYCHFLPSDDPVLRILIDFAPEPLFRSFIYYAKLRSEDRMNPLVYAAEMNKIEHAKTLLSGFANPNHRGVDVYFHKVLPLEAAVWSGGHEMVNILLEAGSHVPHKLFGQALTKSSCTIPPRIVSRLMQTDEFVEWAVDNDEQELFLCALDYERYVLRTISPKHVVAEQDIDTIGRRLSQIGIEPPRSSEASLRNVVSAGHVSTVKHMLSLETKFPTDIILDASRANSEMLRILLDVGYGVNVTSSATGDTPLHLALENTRDLPEDDRFKMVRILVDAGCRLSAHNFYGKTPLHLATSHGYSSIVKYLSLQAPLPPDILLEVLPRHITIIRSLIQEGADVHATRADGRTLLHRLGDLDCVQTIIGAGCNPCLPDALGKTALDIAAANGHFRVVRHLLSIGVPFSPNLLLSVVGAHSSTISIINLLLENGANIHATCTNGNTLLHTVMFTLNESECLKRVKILVNAGCDCRACNLSGKTPFHYAASRGHVMVMKYLLSLGIQIPSDVMLTQFDAVYSNFRKRYSVIRFLLDHGGDVHCATEEGNTLLHSAAALWPEDDSLELVKFLVQAGCRPSIPNTKHELPCHMAAQRGYITIVDYFLSLGISLPPDILLAALTCFRPNPSMLHYLIEKGADISIATKDGDTPLYLLATAKDYLEDDDDHLESFKVLVDAGCDPRAQNVSKQTPMHAAARSGFVSIMKYLLSLRVPLPDDILLYSAPSTILFLHKKGVDISFGAANIGTNLLHRALDRALGCLLGCAPDSALDSAFDYALDCPFNCAFYCEPWIRDHAHASMECVRILVGAGWNPLQRDSVGETPLHIAARHYDISNFQYMLTQGVILPPDILLATASSNRYSSRLVHLLVRKGANVNVATSNGDSPLHLVLRSEKILGKWGRCRMLDAWEVVEILLNCGAEPSAQNVDGQTPFDVAKENGHFFYENFLRLVRGAERVRASS